MNKIYISSSFFVVFVFFMFVIVNFVFSQVITVNVNGVDTEVETSELTDEYKRINNIYSNKVENNPTSFSVLLNRFDEIGRRYQVIEDKFKDRFYARYSVDDVSQEGTQISELYSRVIFSGRPLGDIKTQVVSLFESGASQEVIDRKLSEVNLIILNVANTIRSVLQELSN